MESETDSLGSVKTWDELMAVVDDWAAEATALQEDDPSFWCSGDGEGRHHSVKVHSRERVPVAKFVATCPMCREDEDDAYHVVRLRGNDEQATDSPAPAPVALQATKTAKRAVPAGAQDRSGAWGGFVNVLTFVVGVFLLLFAWTLDD